MEIDKDTEKVGATKPQLFKDVGHYTLWFVIWGVVVNFFQFVTPEQMAGRSFWAVKLQLALYGAGFGVVCAIVFALIQNTINVQRHKPTSWAAAIATWLLLNFSIAYAVGHLH